MSSSSSTKQGLCPAPFLQESLFPTSGGFIEGRFCMSPSTELSCCLPCPQTAWLYPNNFRTITHAASWVNVGGMACSIFLLVTYAVLPVGKTHRHYLSVCLVLATVLMQLGFIVPLAAKPDQCYNDITPNDMYSSRTCAVSGAVLIAGGWAGIMWIFMRALALHLQICWEVVMGRKFMYGALATGWGIPILATALAFNFTGVSFRFGDTCHINHKNSMADFWGPLLVFCAATLIIQFSTFGYCIKVYLASLADDSNTTNSSGALPSYTNSIRTVSPRQAYRRVRRVIELQWRGILIVLVIVADVIFFAVVFVFLDNTEQEVVKSTTKALPWIKCLVKANGDQTKCFDEASALTVSESTVMAVLILIGFNGIWLLLLFGRRTMFTGWYDLVKGRVAPTREFVSADARTYNTKDQRAYEMLSSKELATSPSLKSPEPVVSPLTPTAHSATSVRVSVTPDYLGREAKYHAPQRSFSSPRPPQGISQGRGAVWDPVSTHAKPSQAYDPLGMNKT